jgi:uncharacterized protein
VTSSTYTSEAGPRVRGRHLAIAFGVLLILYGAGYAIGGEVWQIMLAGLQTLPFMLLALLAYLGIDRVWAKVGALGWLVLLVGSAALIAFSLGVAVLLESNGSGPEALPQLVPGGEVRLLGLVAGLGLALVIGALGLLPVVRRDFSRVIPLDPSSFVHMIALVMAMSLTLVSFVPLIVLASPPLLDLVKRADETGLDLTGGRGDTGLLLDTLYPLIWLVPGAIIAVGYGVRRSLAGALERVGLVRPTARQMLAALGLAIVLVGAVQVIGIGIDWLWTALGWPKTDSEAFGELLGFALSPLGAVVIGVTAGLGEELAVRGVLQPRLGILLSNLFFTSLHAFQYSWDALLIVFIVGMTLGFIRKRTNTSTSAIVHGTYDFLLIMAAVLQVPGFSE